MVDFKKINEKAKAQHELKKMMFMDIDSMESTKQIGHFKNHDCWFRRSSSGVNYHVIMKEEDVCNKCDELNDSKYDGKFLFNNKGKMWADPVWINTQTKEKRKFPSIIIAHFFNKYKGLHYYCEITNLTELFEHLHESELHMCYYTFHSTIVKGTFTFEEKGNVSGEDVNPKYTHDFEEYLEMYNFKVWKGKSTFYSIIKDFQNSIPAEFKESLS